MTNQISLFRFTVGQDIYEIRLNVDKTLLSSLPSEASFEEKKRLISDIAQQHIQFSCEELAPLLDRTPQDPLKMDLSTLDKTSNLIQFDEAVKTKSREIALKALKSPTSSTSSTPQEPTGMDALVEDWLKDPDIAQASFDSIDDTPEDLLLAKIDSLPTQTLKEAKIEKILEEFSQSLSSLGSLCQISLTEWLYIIELIKKADPSLSTNEALFKLIAKLKTNQDFTKNLSYLIALETSVLDSGSYLKPDLLRPFFENSSKKEITAYKKLFSTSIGQTKEFMDHEEIMTLRISDTHTQFLNILYKLLEKTDIEIQELKDITPLEIKQHQTFEHDWETLDSQIFSAKDPFATGSFKSTFTSFILTYKDLRQDYQKHRSNASARAVILNFDDFTIEGDQLNDIFEGEKTPKKLHDLLYAKYIAKKKFPPPFTSVAQARDFIKNNFAQIKENKAQGKSYTFQLHQVFFSYDDFSEILNCDACPIDATIEAVINASMEKKYDLVMSEFIRDIPRNLPLSFRSDTGLNQTSIDLQARLNLAVQNVDDPTKKYELQKETIESALGIKQLSIDQKIACIELLYQATPACSQQYINYILFSTADDSPLMSKFDLYPSLEMFFWNAHIMDTDDAKKIHVSFSFTPTNKAPEEASDTIYDLRLIRTINKTTGVVTDTLQVDNSCLIDSKQHLLLDIFHVGRKLNLNIDNQHFLL